MRAKQKVTVYSLILSFAMLVSFGGATIASTSIDYNFNATNDLVSNFNSYVRSGTAQQTATGGLNNSGAINAPGSADAVFTAKSSYSVGPIGSTYTFTSFIKSVGPNGYSGVGFTATQIPSAGNNSGFPYKPNDALGISVHGGGFVLHNGATRVDGLWASDNAGITTIKKSARVYLLQDGSADKWYKLVFQLTRDSNTTFDARIEIWPSNAAGVLISPNAADAIFEWQNITNTNLINSPSIYSYINFSGDRVYYFDDYTVDLLGGSSVVAAGSPVVLTSSATDNSGVVSFAGNVTSDGGTSVTDFGFVYGTVPSPTVSDFKISSGSGVGTFAGATSSLPPGNYYFRSYATNSVGVTYGSEVQVTIAGTNTVTGPTITSPNIVTPTQPAETSNVTSIKLPRFYISASKLTAVQKSTLKKVVNKSATNATYVITGTAGKLPGVTDRAVKALAIKRSEIVKAYLVKLGVNESKITFQYKITNQGTVPKTKVLTQYLTRQ